MLEIMIMRVFLALLVSGLLALPARGQINGAKTGAAKSERAAATKTQADALTPGALHTDTLNYGGDLKKLYVGDFEHVRFARDGTELSMLVSSYMTAYSQDCSESLPKNKVEIMKQECAHEAWMVNGYGVEQPGSRHCTAYRTVGTGRYADPQVYDLQKHLDSATAGSMAGDMLNAVKQGGDLSSGVKKMTDVAIYAGSDTSHLLQDNGCSSPRTMRLQANMIRFGWGKEPIRMPGGAAAVAEADASAGRPSKEQNYSRLLDDLIVEESKAWMMNRYQQGSVRTGEIMRDEEGRPGEVRAVYSYMGLGKVFQGNVRLTFRDAMPDCLYFSDSPAACRAPSPRIISAYRKHRYAD
jgi:hypothetical protein